LTRSAAPGLDPTQLAAHGRPWWRRSAPRLTACLAPQFKAQGVELKNIRKDKPEDRINVTAGVKAACESLKECVLATEVPFWRTPTLADPLPRHQASEPNAEGHRVCTEEDSTKAKAAMVDLLQVQSKAKRVVWG